MKHQTSNVNAARTGRKAMLMVGGGALCVALTVIVAHLSSEGYLGPALCWPKSYDEARAKRVLSRLPEIKCVLELLDAVQRGDEAVVKRLAPTLQPAEEGMLSLGDEVEEIDWRSTWTRWLDRQNGSDLFSVYLYRTSDVYQNFIVRNNFTVSDPVMLQRKRKAHPRPATVVADVGWNRETRRHEVLIQRLCAPVGNETIRYGIANKDGSIRIVLDAIKVDMSSF